MIFIFQPYIITYFTGSLLSFYLAWIIFRRRPSPGVIPFTVFIMAIAWWIFSYGMELAAYEAQDKILWVKMEYCGILLTGLAWLFFALDLSGRQIWRRPRFFIPASIIPAISLILVWTNEWHHWVWSSTIVLNSAVTTEINWQPDFWYWILYVWQYGLFAAGFFLLIRTSRQTNHAMRRQIYTIILGTLIPLMIELGYLFWPFSITLNLLTPLAFLAAASVYSLAIIQYGFLDVVPAARLDYVENNPDGIVVLDNQGIIADINPAARVFCHRNKPEAGRALSEAWPQLNLALTARMETGVFEPAEADQPPLYLEISRTTILDKQSQPAGELIILRNITARRRMEQTLKESESMYSTLVEQSTEGVMIVQNGNVVFANHTLARECGYQPDEVTGRSFLSFVSPEDQAAVAAIHRRRLAGENVPNIYEFRVKCKSGADLDVEVTVGSIVYGGAAAHIINARDISERKQTQRKLETLYQQEKRLRAELQDEIEKRSRYTRALVHELNTPLTAILASGELLETEISDPLAAEQVGIIRKASFALKQRIDELIELARGETGLLKIKIQPINLSVLFKEVESQIQPLSQQKDLKLDMHTEDNLPLVRGDLQRLKQVLHNLVTNAIKYTDCGSIEVRAAAAGDMVAVTVRDSGRGISREELEDLFHPYRQRENAGQPSGDSGIGLSLSRMFIELHGGRLDVESQPGRGSLFRFTIPVYTGRTFTPLPRRNRN